MSEEYQGLTPPPELVQQWLTEGRHQDYCSATEHAIVQAANWGADQELEACCADLRMVLGPAQADWLRSARRPKPPSLKERALQAWVAVEAGTDDQAAMAVIRRALEQLDD